MNKTILIAIVLFGAASSSAQWKTLFTHSDSREPVQMVVTAEPFHGAAVPDLARNDITVMQGEQRLAVTDWLPLRGENAGMELFILVDETNDSSLTAHLGEIRQFIELLPGSMAVGVGYMRNGEATIVQSPTTDHNRAAHAVRPPASAMSAEASPYSSLSFLVNSWPAGALRREVLVISSGVDVFESSGSENIYADMALADAQRAGVIVHCIYAPSVGHAGHSPSLIGWGQTYLAHLAEETGGEAYFTGVQPTVSFAPFLANLTERLDHQYRITFLATPGKGLQPVRFTTSVRDVELVAAYGFFLKTDESLP
jgi:hypothetical protein